MSALIFAAATLAIMAQSPAVLIEQVPSGMRARSPDAAGGVLSPPESTLAKHPRSSNGRADALSVERCRIANARGLPAETGCPNPAALAIPPRASSVERVLIESLGLRNASGSRVRNDSDQQDAGALTANAGSTLSDKSGQAAAILSAQSVTPTPPPGTR